MNIFQEILEMRSMTVIMYRIDDVMPTAPAEDQIVFEKMQNTNKLDEVYALAHDRLGQHEEAQKLRNWIEQQAKRPKFDPLTAE